MFSLLPSPLAPPASELDGDDAMKKLNLALGAGALALAVAGGAIAQQAADHGGHRPMMHDPMGNATVTRAEAQARAAEMFARLDVNKDGKLDKTDREAAMADRLAKHFDEMDANHDGRIDRGEFMAGHQKMMGQGKMERGGMMGRMHRHMMGGMDANKDRIVSRDEFLAGAMKRFDAADANHDGKLTPEERRAAMRALKDRMGGGMKRHEGHGRNGPMDHDMTPPPPPAK